MSYNNVPLIKTVFDLNMMQHVESNICTATVKSVNYSIQHYQKLLLGIGLK